MVYPYQRVREGLGGGQQLLYVENLPHRHLLLWHAYGGSQAHSPDFGNTSSQRTYPTPNLTLLTGELPPFGTQFAVLVSDFRAVLSLLSAERKSLTLWR